MGDGFNNPVAAPNGSLILPNMHSPNYAAGAAGWTINKDGSAEFNNALFRGQVFVGPVNSQIQIGTNIPALVSAFYAGLGNPITTNTAWIGQFVSATQYRYQITGLDGFNRPSYGTGWVEAGTVYENYTEKRQNFSGTNEVVSRYGEFSPADYFYYKSVVNFGAVDFDIGNTIPDNRADLQWAGISLPHGTMTARQFAGNPITTVTGGAAEAALGNFGVTQYYRNRAYKFECWFTIQASAASGSFTLRLRAGFGTGGTVDVVRVFPQLTTNRTEIYVTGIMVTNATPPNQDMTITVQMSAGANVQVFASGSSQGQAHLFDIGSANSYNVGTWPLL